MRTFKITVLLTVLLSIVGAKSFAYDIAAVGEDNGNYIYYNFINNKTELEVTYHSTPYNEDNGSYNGSVVIPAAVMYDGTIYPVTSIGDKAFMFSIYLEEITIPRSIRRSGEQTFSGCINLKKVHISDLSAWCRIDFNATDANPVSKAEHLYLNGEEIKDLVIPNDVAAIADGAFQRCVGLNSVTIPSNVTSIGRYAFNGCSGLTSIDIPNSVTFIGEGAFYQCSGLTSVNLPNSITMLSPSVFEGCI